MTFGAVMTYLPLLAMLCVAVVVDVRCRRIPDWLTLAIASGGLTQSFLPGSAISPIASALGVLVGGLLLIGPFAIGATGGGDVKLLAAIGAWLGPWGAVLVLAVECLVGLVVVVAQAAHEGRLRNVLRNSLLLSLNVAHVRRLGAEHVAATGEACGRQSASRPLPRAVPFLAAVVIVLCWS
jgi:prepilin peptidase CpaA